MPRLREHSRHMRHPKGGGFHYAPFVLAHPRCSVKAHPKSSTTFAKKPLGSDDAERGGSKTCGQEVPARGARDPEADRAGSLGEDDDLPCGLEPDRLWRRIRHDEELQG